MLLILYFDLNFEHTYYEASKRGQDFLDTLYLGVELPFKRIPQGPF